MMKKISFLLEKHTWEWSKFCLMSLKTTGMKELHNSDKVLSYELSFFRHWKILYQSLFQTQVITMIFKILPRKHVCSRLWDFSILQIFNQLNSYLSSNNYVGRGYTCYFKRTHFNINYCSRYRELFKNFMSVQDLVYSSLCNIIILNIYVKQMSFSQNDANFC